MKALFSLQHALTLLLALVTVAMAYNVIYQFAWGQHYIIPTGWLVPTILCANLVHFCLAGRRWACALVFWIGVLATANLFFGIFFAQTPPQLLGAAFLPTWLVLTVLMAALTFNHARRNPVFRAEAA